MPPRVADILDALEQTWRSLDGVLSELDNFEWHLPTGCPGWDVQDTVSHIIGVEIGLDNDPAPGHHVDTSGLSPAGVEMEPAVDYRRGRAPEEVLAEFRDVTAASLVRRRSADIAPEQETDGPLGWRMPFWRLLCIRVFDCYAHEQDIRRAVGRPGNHEGPAADISRRQIAGALRRLLPQRLPELADQTIEIVVEGSTIRAGAEGGEPVATLTVDFANLVALACGRADAQTESVTITGDERVGKRVVAVMGFTP